MSQTEQEKKKKKIPVVDREALEASKCEKKKILAKNKIVKK